MFKEENRKKTIAAIAAVLVFVLMIVLSIVDREAHTAHANIEDETLAVITETTSVSTSTSSTTSTTSTTSTDVTTSTQITTTTENTTTSTSETSTTTTEAKISVANEEIGEAVEEIAVRELNESRADDNVVEAITIEPVIETIPSETTTSLTTTVAATTEYVETVVESNEIKLGNFRITGYVATGNKTASGTWPSAGRTIAMNKSQMKTLGLSYGDTIRIEGLGTYILEDCGCASGRIDVFCSSVKACYALTSYADAYLVK